MKRILLADDEDAIRRLMRSLLARSGFEILEARNGIEAIEIIRSDSFDLAIVDLMMPIANGYRVLEVLRSETPTVPVLIVSAAGEVGLGMLPVDVPVLRKPFDADDLTRMVNDLIGASESVAGDDLVS